MEKWQTVGSARKALAGFLVLTLVLTLVLVQTAAALAMSDTDASRPMARDEIIQIIENTARRKNIPPQILKAIAWKESRFTQFTSSGAPLVSRGNRGVMQVNSVHTSFDPQRILYDVTYNIEAGADILLSKWLDNRTPVVGNRDPNVLEHWYFALWAYNGWLSRNNPNLHGETTYQDRIFDYIRINDGIEVSTVDWCYIPASGLPVWGSHIPEPAATHKAGILFYQPGDRALVDVRDTLYVQTHAGGGNVLFSLVKDQEVIILSQPQLVEGLYWYEVIHPATGQKGWAAGIYLKPVFVQHEAAADALGALLLAPDLGKEDLVEQATTSREEKATALPEALETDQPTPAGPVKKDINEKDIKGNDINEKTEVTSHKGAAQPPAMEAPSPVVSPFFDMQGHPAQKAVDTLAALGVISTRSGEFRPHQNISRQELTVMLDAFFQLNQRQVTLEEQLAQLAAYEDSHLIGAWAQEAMARAVVLGIIGGYPDGTIRPQAPATREQGMVMLSKALEGRVLENEICATKYFEDGNNINAWALTSVNVLLDMGVFNGVDSTSLNPRHALTRVEVAVVLYRIHLLQ